MGLCDRLRVAVLRLAEVLAPDMGSQLHDWLSGLVCLRPVGFDPMLDLLSLDDASRAFELVLDHEAQGVFNVPGADVLPLSRAARLWGRDDLPLPGPLVDLAYGLRRRVGGGTFRYDLNRRRFHASGVLDGTRAREVLGYRPEHPLDWPRPDLGGG
jgi:UDP-glucose 4-epimerase